MTNTKQQSQPQWLACLVDYCDKLSNLLEDLLEVEKFANSVECSDAKENYG